MIDSLMTRVQRDILVEFIFVRSKAAALPSDGDKDVWTLQEPAVASHHPERRFHTSRRFRTAR